MHLEHLGEVSAAQRVAAGAEAGLDDQLPPNAVCVNAGAANVEHIAAVVLADFFHTQAGRAGQVQAGLQYATSIKRVLDVAHNQLSTDHATPDDRESCTEQRQLDVEPHVDDVAASLHRRTSTYANAVPAVCTTTQDSGVLESPAKLVVLATGLAPQSFDSVHVSRTPLLGPTADCLNHLCEGRCTDTAAKTRQDIPSATASSSAGRECDFQELISMGFSEHRVALAMEECAGQPTRALDLLLETPEQTGRRLAVHSLVTEHFLEATSHSTAPRCPSTARATAFSSGGEGQPCRSILLASCVERLASEEQPLEHSQGLCAAGPLSRKKAAVSMQPSVARAGYTSCPGCEVHIPNKFLADHLEYACKSHQSMLQPPDWKTTSADTKGLGTSAPVTSTGDIAVLSQSEQKADSFSQPHPESPLPVVGVMQGLVRCRQTEPVWPTADWHDSENAVTHSDLVHQPSDIVPNAVKARYPEGWRSLVTVSQLMPAEAQVAIGVARSESITHCPLGQSDLVDSPGSESLCEAFSDSQAVRKSCGGAGSMSLPCPTLGSAPFEPASQLDRKDPSDITFHIHKSHVYNRGQWRGGGSTTLQLLQNATFRVPETPDASQCTAEADAHSGQNLPAVRYDHRPLRQGNQF